MLSRRWRSLLFAVALLVGGAGACWLAVAQIIGVNAMLRAKAALITWWPRGPSGLPIGLALIILGALCTVRAPDISSRDFRRNRGVNGRTDAVVEAGLYTALACLVVTPFAAVIGKALIAGRVEAHGYRPCPSLDGERPTNDRWIRPGVSCPRTRETADRMIATVAPGLSPPAHAR